MYCALVTYRDGALFRFLTFFPADPRRSRRPPRRRRGKGRARVIRNCAGVRAPARRRSGGVEGSCLVDVREETEGRLRDLLCGYFRACSREWRKRSDWLIETGVLCDWLPKNQNSVVGNLSRCLVVGGRGSSTFTTIKTGRSPSHVCKLSGIDYEATGVACFGFLPNFGRSAGVVVSGRTAGKQFRQ